MSPVNKKAALIFFFFGVLLHACASPPKQDLTPLKWPEPPLKTRIAFLQTLTSDADLGRTASWKERILELLTGQEPHQQRLFQPMDVAVSDDGTHLYISDYGQFQVFVFDLKHKKVTYRGPFNRPFGLALDGEENLYVVEQGTGTIQILDAAGNRSKTIRHPALIRPTDIVIDRRRRRLYVADPASKGHAAHTVKIFDLAGGYLGGIGNEKGEAPGQLYFPTYLALDRFGNLYVSNTMNARVDVFSPEGVYLKTIGERGNAFGMFDKPKGIALDGFGHLYVVDSNWSNVQIFNQKGEVLLYFGGRGNYPGLLKNPTGIAIDRNNQIYVADLLNTRITVYQLVNSDDIRHPNTHPSAEAEASATGKME
ncbi:MAG: SMP-30/gluconolactonase/LRE family protein [Nitrospiria bacterium]